MTARHHVSNMKQLIDDWYDSTTLDEEKKGHSLKTIRNRCSTEIDLLPEMESSTSGKDCAPSSSRERNTSSSGDFSVFSKQGRQFGMDLGMDALVIADKKVLTPRAARRQLSMPCGRCNRTAQAGRRADKLRGFGEDFAVGKVLETRYSF
eukprot:s9581_g1.t1